MTVSATEKVSAAVVKTAHGIINLSVLLAFLVMLSFSLYAIWDSDQVYHAAGTEQYAVYKPTVEDEGLSFEQLKSINSEVIAWLSVYGTNIDYPITQAEDNMKYVNTDAYGNYSLSGSIFLDSYNSKDFNDFNSILYGHHMEKQAMFGDLDQFSDQFFFESHEYGNLYYSGKDHGLEFFAFIKTDAYDGAVFTPKIQGSKEQNELLQELLSKALYSRDIGITVRDKILLLTTCSSDVTNGRDVLLARITSESYVNPFNLDKTDEKHQQAFVDSQSSILEIIPLWMRLAVLFILVLLVVILLITIRNNYARR